MSVVMTLADRDRAVLDLEREWWLTHPTKQAAIADRLQCSAASYYSALRRLATSGDAYDYDPLVVRRLRRRADRLRRERIAGGAPAERQRR